MWDRVVVVGEGCEGEEEEGSVEMTQTRGGGGGV